MVIRSLFSQCKSADMVCYQQHVVRTAMVIARGDQPECNSHKRERNLDDEQLGVEL